MNAISPSLSSAALWDRYVRLPPGAKLVLRLKSLIVPGVPRGDFANVLARTGLRAIAGGSWSSQSVNPVINDLLSKGFLTADLDCEPGLLHHVAADAAASEDAKVLAQAIRLVLPSHNPNRYYESTDSKALWRLIRLEVYTNNEVEFRLNRNLCDKTFGPQSTVMTLEFRLVAPLVMGEVCDVWTEKVPEKGHFDACSHLL